MNLQVSVIEKIIRAIGNNEKVFEKITRTKSGKENRGTSDPNRMCVCVHPNFVFSTSDRFLSDVLLLSKVRFSVKFENRPQ